MGAKTKATTVPTLNASQQAMLEMMMRGSLDQMKGSTLGQTWAGPGTTSMQGYGGKPWDMSTPVRPTPGGGAVNPNGGAILAVQPAAANAAQAPIPASSNFPATNPVVGAPDPFGMAAYSDRNQLVSPIVNPFRRNLGG